MWCFDRQITQVRGSKELLYDPELLYDSQLLYGSDLPWDLVEGVRVRAAGGRLFAPHRPPDLQAVFDGQIWCCGGQISLVR